MSSVLDKKRTPAFTAAIDVFSFLKFKIEISNLEDSFHLNKKFSILLSLPLLTRQILKCLLKNDFKGTFSKTSISFFSKTTITPFFILLYSNSFGTL
ncbi:hypothetical protein LPB303_03755 [Polaribacter atrinae]|uniref:Uncharacterized protein n=1 Tax=Polaribacter atrinae TaxID=1333662 RepID=A0A176TDT7_9FLAO|nr:hypothetical protein LPB303_03755 [Polaribacter atrinae]